MVITQKIGDKVVHRIPMKWKRADFIPSGEFAITFTVKASPSDDDEDSLIQKRSGGYGISESNRFALVTILPIDTSGSEDPVVTPIVAGRYVFDLQAQNISDPADIRTVAEGEIVLLRDVFRGTETAVNVYVAEPPLRYDTQLITYQ